MGKARHPVPSPIQMLALLQARGEGMPAQQIRKRTGYGASTVLRWYDAWGHDAALFDHWRRTYRIDVTGHTFEDYWPTGRIPLPTLPPDALDTRFVTALGRR